MSWQFTIIDYTTNPAGVSTPIAEPVGWDGINLHLKRDENWHGFFSYVDDSFGGLQFDGAGAAILRNAYYNFGINADVRLSISYSCGDDNQNELSLYVGSFFFSSFKDYLADRCYVECSLEANRDFMNFKNRVDQQVDLDSLVSFDELPSVQTATAQAWFQAGTNIIRFDKLINGLQPGSTIQLTGASNAANQGHFTVLSAQPDDTNVMANVVSGELMMQSYSVIATFDSVHNTITVNQLLPPLANGTFVITEAVANNGANNRSFTLSSNALPYFDTTVYPVSGSVTQEDVACTISAVFTAMSQPQATLVTVINQNISYPALVDEPVANNAAPSVTMQGSWYNSNLNIYPGLGEVITLPAKVITETSLWQSDGDSICDTKIHLSLDIGTINRIGAASFSPPWNAVLTEIDSTSAASGEPTTVSAHEPSTTYSNGNPPETLLFFNQNTIPCAGSGVLTIQFSGTLYPGAGVGGDYGVDYFNFQGVLDSGFTPDYNGSNVPHNCFLNQDIRYAGQPGYAHSNSSNGTVNSFNGISYTYTCSSTNNGDTHNGQGINNMTFSYHGYSKHTRCTAQQ